MKPNTELDQQFSAPEVKATAWDEVRRTIEDAQLFWISTVRADGRPHVTPLVAVWVDDALHFCTGPAEQKAVNLEANSQVILTTGSNTWDEGLDVVVEGQAKRVTDPAMLRRLANAWTRKWDGFWQYEAGEGVFKHEGGEALVFGVSPTKVLSFDKRTGSASRHRFDDRPASER